MKDVGGDEDSDIEDDTKEKKKLRMKKMKNVEDKELQEMGKVMMTKKARRIHTRIQYGANKKQETVQKLKSKRKVLDAKKSS